MIPIILGPTGSGKTKISIDLARELNGEIISADSRAIYKHLDLGTAKPTLSERTIPTTAIRSAAHVSAANLDSRSSRSHAVEPYLIPHHGFDLVNLGDRFTVADWKTYAKQKISEIRARGHLPIIAGGTGLYIDALIFDYQFRGPTGAKINDFEQKSCSDRKEIKGDYLLIGLDIPREELRSHLRQRIDQMFTPELFEEYKKFVQPAISKNPDQIFAKAGNIYRFVAEYLAGNLTLEEAKEKAFYADYHLAKRQLTWFRRNSEIVWLSPPDIMPYALNALRTQSLPLKTYPKDFV